MPRPIDDLYLSPHFDDAVLSCGGTIHRRARAGRREVVLTVCAGPPTGALSAFAAEHHRRWGATPGEETEAAAAMVARRRGEDDAALALLGAEAAGLIVPDAIYRRMADGRAPYADLATLFGPVDSGERGLIDATAARLSDLAADLGVGHVTCIWLPLAVGGHVDHRLTRATAEAWLRANRPTLDRNVVYYEDLPYAASVSAVEIASLAVGMRRQSETIDDADLAAKIAAVACYGSQISTFWADEAAMAADVRAWVEAHWLPDGYNTFGPGPRRREVSS